MKTYILKISVVFVCFFFSLKVSAQCDIEKYQIGRKETQYDVFFSRYISKSPMFVFAPNGDTSTKWNVLLKPISLNQMPDDLIKARKMVEDWIKENSGNWFFRDITFMIAGIACPEMVEYFRKNGGGNTVGNYSNPVKYWFTYQITVDSLSYLTPTVAIGHDGKIFRAIFFPKPDTYKHFKRPVDYCKLFAIAQKANKNSFPLKSIDLSFDESAKQYCWRVVQLVPHPDGASGVDYPVTKIKSYGFFCHRTYPRNMVYQVLNFKD